MIRVNADVRAVAKNCNTEKEYISWCVSSLDRSNDSRVIVQSALKTYFNIVFTKESLPNVTFKKFTQCYNPLFDLGLNSAMERRQDRLATFENHNDGEPTHDASIIDTMDVTE